MLLASAATLPVLLATAGCRSSDAFTGPDPLAGRPPLPHDVLTLQAVIAAEENLIAVYQAAIRGDPGTSARAQLLRPLLAQHEQHLARLRAMLIEPPGTTASASPGPGGSGASSPRASGAPAQVSPAQVSPAQVSPAQVSPAQVSTARLRAAERASAADLVQRLVTVQPALAQLLASIAASDATHVTVLGG